MTAMALAVLEDALARAHIGPIAREPSIRLALAWLQRSGIAEAWQVRQFWEVLASERDRTDYEGPAQYLETTLMTGAIDRWRRSAQLPCGEGLGIARLHRIRALAPDLAPRPGTPHLPCMCNRYRPGERQQIEHGLKGRPEAIRQLVRQALGPAECPGCHERFDADDMDVIHRVPIAQGGDPADVELRCRACSSKLR